MRTVTVFVPFLPAAILSPNRGERRGGRIPQDISEAKRQLRGDTCLWLLSKDEVKAVTSPFERARVSVTMHWDKRKADGVYRAMDPTNACYALKAMYDGIVDAGLIVDDSWRHFVLGDHIIEPGHTPEGCWVTIEELEATSARE